MFRQFGVPVLFIPGDSVRRRTITGIPVYDKQSAQADNDIESDNEQVWLCVKKDRDDATWGGVDDPKFGDSILLNGEAEDRKFSFQNQVRSDAGGSWELLFARKRPRRFGGRR